MDVTLSLLADAANASQDGKLNILGVFRIIQATQMPAVHPHMMVVLKISASLGERGTHHHLTLATVDDDGKLIVDPIEMPFAVPDAPGNDLEVNMLTTMRNIPFPRFGDYRIDIAIDREPKAQIEFAVRQSPLSF